MKDTFTTYKKVNGKWTATYTEENPERAKECLMRDLFNHYINKCSYIKRITDRCNYNGTRTITVYMKMDTVTLKYVYIVHI